MVLTPLFFSSTPMLCKIYTNKNVTVQGTVAMDNCKLALQYLDLDYVFLNAIAEKKGSVRCDKYGGMTLT